MSELAEKYLSLRAAFSREHCVAGSNPANRKGLLKAWIASLRSQRRLP
jgi:hypothetical protein